MSVYHISSIHIANRYICTVCLAGAEVTSEMATWSSLISAYQQIAITLGSKS